MTEAARIIETTRQYWEIEERSAMDTRLMSHDDLKDVTGKKRYSAQAAWFKQHFGMTPVQSADGRIIITWAAFEGLQAKRAGVGPATSGANTERPPLMPVRRAA